MPNSNPLDEKLLEVSEVEEQIIPSLSDTLLYPFLEASYPLINGFNSAGIALTMLALMSIDTDDETRDDVDHFILLSASLLTFYGVITQITHQWFSHLINNSWKTFEKYFSAFTDACSTHFFALAISESAYIEKMTSGKGTNEEVIVTPLEFGLLNIAPAFLALLQLYSELNSDKHPCLKKLKETLLDTLKKIIILEGIYEATEDLAGISRNSAIAEMLPRYLISAGLGSLLSYYAYQSHKKDQQTKTPAYKSLPLYLEDLLSGFSLGLFQFEQVAKKLSPLEINLFNVFVIALGTSSCISRYRFGKSFSPSTTPDQIMMQHRHTTLFSSQTPATPELTKASPKLTR